MTNATKTLSNRRIFFLGVNTGYATHGLPDDRYVEFYRRRASPHLYCAIIGNVVVPGGSGSNEASPTLTTHPVWSKIAEAIRDRGSIPGIQLATAWPGYVGTRQFVSPNSDQVIAEARQVAAELGPTGVASILDAFKRAAMMAIDHGFRHVQIHGAHGYLISLLIDQRINRRADAVLESLADIAVRLTSAGVETSIRISMRTGDLDFDSNGTGSFHDKIAALPFDYIDLSSGFYKIDKRLIYPARPEFLADRLAESRAVAQRHPTRAFIFSGRALNTVVDELPANLHIGLCRDIIANPEFLSDLTHGCRSRNKCHYHSRGDAHLTCALWKDPLVSQ